MTVRELMELLKKCDYETDVFSSGLDASHMNRSLVKVNEVEVHSNYIVLTPWGK